ncbi:ATP-binding protein [Bradyrhizobium sp. STM 3557]|uniref:ATP-binding protein n=1 Tax=Bradyrhizobium sp. STM 3557 TaxID=578920 RepID=UPI00388FDAF5
MQTRIWSNLSLRKRLLLPIAAMVLGALVSGVLALQIFSPDQFEHESELEAGSARVVAAALNAALAVASNPEQTLDAFAASLGTSESIKFVSPGAAADPPRIGGSGVPAWFVSHLTIPELSKTYPIMIGPAHVGNLVLSPDLSADIREKWIGLLAIISSSSLPMLLAAISTYLVVGAALRPMERLAAGLVRFREGDYEMVVPVVGPPEIRQFCAQANELAATFKRLNRDNRELLRRMVSLQDDERRELAREVHDEMGPLLFAIRANAAALTENAEGSCQPGSAVHGIVSAAEALQQANQRILEGLSPLYVADLGLIGSIQALLRNAQKQAPTIRLVSRIAPDLDRLDALLSQTVYRLIQEGVTNALRHARAAAIDVMARIEDGHVAIEISDDGIGVPDQLKFGRGLTGMLERVRALNGTLELIREQGRTVVRCRLPLESHREN